MKIRMFLLAWSPIHSKKFEDHELYEQGGVSLCVIALNGLFSH